MPRILVTGGGGLIGSRVCELFHARGFEVVSVDDDLRGKLLDDPEGSVQWNLERLAGDLPHFTNYSIDIRDGDAVKEVFSICKPDVVVHCAAQPAHEGDLWLDFTVNVVGTLNVLQEWKACSSEAPFVYLSTIKVYGNSPNRYLLNLDLQRRGQRYDLTRSHRYYEGFDESLPLGGAGEASFFSRSKTAADLYVQEFAYQLGLSAVCLRPSCITGGNHSGTESHGMLAYMMKCAFLKRPYTIYGYEGYQVRDQLHVNDLVDAIWKVAERPAESVVFNIGGGRFLACSILEVIALCEEVSGNSMEIRYGSGRGGDHAWWVTDTSRFRRCYPAWKPQVGLRMILEDIYVEGRLRWTL